MPIPIRFIMAASVVTSLIATPLAYGYYVSDVVSVQQQGDITFVSGGIGDEERQAMQDMRRDYNLHITSSGKDGAFTGDTSLTIHDRMGNEVLQAQSGPLFYVNLPAGKYTVAAENEGALQNKAVKVSQRTTSTLHFVWK